MAADGKDPAPIVVALAGRGEGGRAHIRSYPVWKDLTIPPGRGSDLVWARTEDIKYTRRGMALLQRREEHIDMGLKSHVSAFVILIWSGEYNH